MTDELNAGDMMDDGAGMEPSFDDAGDVGGSADENPWSWVDERGVKPEDVRKSFEGYTQKSQEIAEMKRSLEPYMELEKEIKSNPELQVYLRKFYDEGPNPELKMEALREEFESMRNEMTVKEELIGLNEFVNEGGLPEFDQRKLLEYAAKEGFPNLKAAYKDMMFDEIRQASEDGAYDKVKKTRGAAVPKVNESDKRKRGAYTEEDLEKMSDEDFIENYAEIAKSLSRGM